VTPAPRNAATLFKGFKFLINREIPKPEIRFMIRAFGGEDFTEYDAMDSDPKITHHIVDREWPKRHMRIGREYIQPQWLFDSINAGILLPYHEYAPAAKLPAHISPFVNDARRGYIPEQREHLDELIAREKGIKKDEEDEEEDGLVIGADDEDEDATSLEAMYAMELSQEQQGKSYADYVKDELGDTPLVENDESDDEAVTKALKTTKTKKQLIEEKQKQEDKEREAMSIDLLNRKTRQIVRSVKERQEKRETKIATLNEKRKAVERKRKAEEKLKTTPTETSGSDDLKRKNEAPAGNGKAKKLKK